MQLLLEALTYHRYSDEPTSIMVILLVRVTLVVAAGWLASQALAQSSAAIGHRVWLLTILGMLVVPAVWALTPSWRVPLLTVHVHGAQVSERAAASPLRSAWPDVLVAVWIVGTGIALCYMALGIYSAWRLFRGSRPCTDRLWLELLACVRHEAGLARKVELRMTDRSLSPAVWSFWRVQILVPAESNVWPLAQRRSVLVHELAHVVRQDCALQMLANLACAVWWFHPLAWWAAGRLRATSELAADDFVLRNGGGRTEYAGQLLSIARSLGSSRLPAAAQTMFHPSHLERRLRAILDPTRPRDALVGWRSLASVATALVLAVPLATLTPSTVRAVPDPAPKTRSNNIDVHLRLRLFMPVAPPQGTTFQVLTSDVGAIVPQSPAPPRRATMELIPNWDMSKHAEHLIPNFVPGTAQVILVEPQPAPTASGAVPRLLVDPRE